MAADPIEDILNKCRESIAIFDNSHSNTLYKSSHIAAAIAEAAVTFVGLSEKQIIPQDRQEYFKEQLAILQKKIVPFAPVYDGTMESLKLPDIPLCE